MKKSKLTFLRYRSRFLALVKHPLFWTLTIVGNSIIFVGSLLIYRFENTPTRPIEFLDCLLWSTGTVTTIGYGEFTPHSFPGKLTILALMLFGTLFVWSYMAFWVTGLIAPELASLEKDVHQVEKEVHALKIDRREPNE